VHRAQVTRWVNGDREVTFSRLTELIAPLGWAPVITLERTAEALDALLVEPPEPGEVLGWAVQRLLSGVAELTEAGIDVVVGGEVAAVLQGVPVPTRHMVWFVRPDQRTQFKEVLTRRHLWLEPDLQGRTVVRTGDARAEVRFTDVLPACRVVTDRGRAVKVVDLARLCADPGALGGSMRAAAGRLTDRAS
jgi:hypothetical protein